MSEAQEKLTTAQVDDAGLADWRQIAGRLKARFRTGDFRTGLALVDRIGQSAEAANHHPDVQLTYSDVIVSLVSHDAGGLTTRDVELAREISGHAAELSVEADPGGLTAVELGLDTSAGSRLSPFYAALLSSPVDDDGEAVDPSGQAPTVWWQEPGPPDDPHALPAQPFEQRWHLDVWVAPEEAERRLQALLAAGGRLVSDLAAPRYWVVEDADGNRSCICTSTGR